MVFCSGIPGKQICRRIHVNYFVGFSYGIMYPPVYGKGRYLISDKTVKEAWDIYVVINDIIRISKAIFSLHFYINYLIGHVSIITVLT